MHICVTNLSFLKKTPTFFLNRISNLGYDNVEIAPYLLSKKPFVQKVSVNLKKILKKKKIKIQSLQSLFFSNKMFNKKHDIQKYFLGIFKFANYLNIRKISLGNAPFRKLKNSKKNLQYNEKLLIKIADLAKKYNIRICIEPISKKYNNFFLQNHFQVLKLIKKLKKTNIKILFDFGNYEEEKKFNLHGFFSKNIKFIEHVHIRNSDMKKINIINIKKKILFLKKYKYRKSLTIEYLNDNGFKLPNLINIK